MALRSPETIDKPVRILLVDDNRHGLVARKSILEELGHEMTVSSDPVEALEVFRNGAFDLVITDYKMPRMDGIELIANIRAITPAMSVILISGFVDALGLTEENTGSDAVVQKSANEVQQLVRAVTRVMRKRTPKKPAGSVTKTANLRANSKGVS
ncbi:MAG TPA: response regulator [Bryobacteraceae bacterium]|nr:response regulator [Bryobacteraceae bacterium]